MLSKTDKLAKIFKLDYFENVVFVFNRRMLAGEYLQRIDQAFEVIDAEEFVNDMINNSVETIKGSCFKSCISGGITPESIRRIMHLSAKPDYIKTGMFTLNISDSSIVDVIDNVAILQATEVHLLERISDALKGQAMAVDVRLNHLKSYCIS